MPTVDQLTSFIMGVATLATALATFLTVREMARQRRASYRPDIVAARQYAYAYATAGSNGLRFAWSRERTVASEANEKFLLGENTQSHSLTSGLVPPSKSKRLGRSS